MTSCELDPGYGVKISYDFQLLRPLILSASLFIVFFTHKPSFTTKLTFLTFLKFPLKMPPKHIRFTSSSSEEDENFGDDDAGGPHGTPSSSLHADAGRRSSVERKPRGELQGGASSSNKKRRLSLPSSLPSLQGGRGGDGNDDSDSSDFDEDDDGNGVSSSINKRHRLQKMSGSRSDGDEPGNDGYDSSGSRGSSGGSGGGGTDHYSKVVDDNLSPVKKLIPLSSFSSTCSSDDDDERVSEDPTGGWLYACFKNGNQGYTNSPGLSGKHVSTGDGSFVVDVDDTWNQITKPDFNVGQIYLLKVGKGTYTNGRRALVGAPGHFLLMNEDDEFTKEYLEKIRGNQSQSPNEKVHMVWVSKYFEENVAQAEH